jgi:hypothetical protein
MPFDDSGRFSWDGMKSAITDGQKAAEHRSWRQGMWWVEEMTVRDGESGHLIGTMQTKTLISKCRVPELAVVRVKVEGHRFE